MRVSTIDSTSDEQRADDRASAIDEVHGAPPWRRCEPVRAVPPARAGDQQRDVDAGASRPARAAPSPSPAGTRPRTRGSVLPSPLSIRFTSPTLMPAAVDDDARDLLEVVEARTCPSPTGRPPSRRRRPGERLGTRPPSAAIGAAWPAATSSRPRASTSAGIVTSACRRSCSSSPRTFCSASSASARAAWPACSARSSARLASRLQLGLDLAQLVLLLRASRRSASASRHLGAHLRARPPPWPPRARVRLGDLGVAHDLGDPLAADALEVVRVVGDVLDLEHVELQAELLEVRLDLRRERVGELQAILVDLLGRHRREHAAEVTLERLLRRPAGCRPGRVPRKRSIAFITPADRSTP